MATNLTLSQIKTLADDPVFKGQVQVGATRQALTMINAPSTTHATADTKRWSLAASTLVDGCIANLTRFTYGIASTAGFDITAGSPPSATDAAIASALVSQWDRLAGITPGDTGG